MDPSLLGTSGASANSANASGAPPSTGPLPVGPHGSAHLSSGTSATTVTLTAEQWAAIQSTLDQINQGHGRTPSRSARRSRSAPRSPRAPQSPERSSRRNSHHTRRDSRSRSPGHYHRRRSPSRDYSNRRYDGASRPLLKPKVPDIYKGSSHKELHEFARQCHEYFKTARAHPDDSSSVSFAASFLRGETVGHVWSEYVKTLPLDYDPPWAEFLKVLRDDLGNEKTFVDKTWGKFFSFVQRPGDNVRTFSVQLQQLCSVLQEYDLHFPRESDMIRRARDALRPEIKSALYHMVDNASTYSQFVALAMQAEASVNMHTSTKNSSHRDSRRDKSRDASQTRSSKTQGKNHRRGKGNNKPTESSGTSANKTPATGANAEPPAEVTCYRCGEKGHISTHCTNPPKPKN